MYTILELPHSVSAAASLAVNAAGVVGSKAVALPTPGEIDEATKRTADHRAPGA